MNTKAILKTGLEALLVSCILISCNRVQDSSKIHSILNESVESVKKDFEKEISDLRSEAEIAIAEFNNKTFEIRREALKSRKNIDTEIKQRIIDIENQVIQLEDKLEDLSSQSVETWSDFSREMKDELVNIKRNIDNLTTKNAV
jgi:hypothetical protein